MRCGEDGTVTGMDESPTPAARHLVAAHDFDAATLTGLLDAGVPQRFLRTLIATFAGPDQWRAAALLPGEDPRWRSVSSRDPDRRAFVLGSDGYPWMLERLATPPAILYASGTLNEDRESPGPMVCVAGSRAMSALGRNVVDVVVDEIASLGATLLCGTEAGVEEYAARTALARGVATVLVASCGSDAANERVSLLCRDIVSSGGVVLSPFARDVRASSFTQQAASRILAAFAYPLVVAEAAVPSASTALAADAFRAGSPILVPLPRRGFRDAAGARGLLALADVEHARLLGWDEELLARRGVNGFANAVAENGDDLRTMLRVLWWLRPRPTEESARRTEAPR